MGAAYASLCEHRFFLAAVRQDIMTCMGTRFNYYDA